MAEDIEIRIKAAIDTAESATKVNEVRKALKDLQSLALEIDDKGSDSFKKVNKAAGDLRDKVGDVNQAFKSMSGEPIENLTRSFTGLRQSLASGDFKSAKVMFNNMNTSIVDMGKSLLGIGTGAKSATIALRGFGVALAATGITVLIAAVVLLIKYWDDLKQSTGVLGDMVRKLSEKFEKIKQVVVDFVKNGIQYLVDKFVELYNNSMLIRSGIASVELIFKLFVNNVRLGANLIIDLFKTIGSIWNDIIHLRNPLDGIKKHLQEVGDDFKKWGTNIKDGFVNAYEDITKGSLKPVGKLFGEIKKKGDKSLKDTKDRLKDEKDAWLKHQQELAAQLMANINALETWRVQQQEDSLNKRLLLFDLQSEKEEEKLRQLGAKDGEITEWRNKKVAEITKKWYDEQQKLREEQALKRKEDSDKEVEVEREKQLLLLSIQSDSAEKAKQQWLLENAEKIEKLRQAGADEIAIRNWVNSELAKIDAQYATNTLSGFDKLQEAVGKWQASVKESLDKAADWLQTFSFVANGISQIMSDVSQTRLNNEEENRNKSLESLEAQKERGILTDQQYAEAKYQIELKSYKREHELRKKAFKQQKAMQIVQAIIGTAQGVVAALSEPFFPMMIARLAMAGATGAAQIALIASQKMPDDGGAPSAPSMGGSVGMPSTPDTQQQNAPQAPNFFGLGQNNLLTGGGSDQRVFVVESDISATQGRVAKIRERSTLGN